MSLNAAFGDARRLGELASARFTFTGLGLLDNEDPLGIWEPAVPTVTAFAAETAEQGLRWRIDLPASPHEARPELRSRLVDIKDYQVRLALAEQRLLQLEVPPPFVASAVAEPASAMDKDGERIGAAEVTLLAEIRRLQGVPTAYVAVGGGAVSYGLLPEKADQLLVKFRRLVQYYARIDTTVGGRSIGLTVVDWSGDYETTWQDGVTSADMSLHLEAVKLALASRQALLRLVTVVTSGALALAAKAALPGGQVLLFPAVYKYVRDVLAELDRYADSRGVSG